MNNPATFATEPYRRLAATLDSPTFHRLASLKSLAVVLSVIGCLFATGIFLFKRKPPELAIDWSSRAVAVEWIAKECFLTNAQTRKFRADLAEHTKAIDRLLWERDWAVESGNYLRAQRLNQRVDQHELGFDAYLERVASRCGLTDAFVKYLSGPTCLTIDECA